MSTTEGVQPPADYDPFDELEAGYDPFALGQTMQPWLLDWDAIVASLDGTDPRMLRQAQALADRWRHYRTEADEVASSNPFVLLDADTAVPLDEMTGDHIRRRIAYAASTEPLGDALADELSYWAQRIYNGLEND